MRVTQYEIYRNFLGDLERLNADFAAASRQISSGKKLMQMSDSPGGASDLISLTEQAAKIDLYRSNTNTGLFFLGVAESALNEVNNLVTAIYTKGSQAASELVTDDARAMFAEDIRALRDQILSLANTKARNRYLFAGSQVNSAPFVKSGDSVTYQGDGDVSSVRISKGVEIQLCVPGSDPFNAIFASIESLLAAMDGNDLSGMRSELQQFSSALSDLGKVRGQIGSRLGLLEGIQAKLDSTETLLKKQKSSIEDADLVAATMQLNQTKTALDAAMTAGGAFLSQSNLFDILG
jgi:flagellar hook-associated protein 3 FlgL